MRTLLLRSGSALLTTHDCVGSPRALLAVLRTRLLQTCGERSVATLTLARPPAAAVHRALRDDVAELAPVVAERSADSDVVHALDLVAGAAALAARRASGVPVVVRDQPAARGSLRGARRCAPAWVAVLRAADGVVVPTTEDAQAARAVGVRADRLTVCADGALVARAECADPVAAPAPAAEDRYLLGLSGVPGRRSVREGLVGALAADRELRLVLAGCQGSDVERRELVDLAHRQGAADRVELHGALPPEQVLGLVDGSAAVVTTRSDPSSALSALVAMHRARPVVGVQSVAAADVLVDGVTGHLVRPGHSRLLAEALTETVADPFRRLSWGLAGLDRVTSRYDRDLVMGSVLRAYEAVA